METPPTTLETEARRDSGGDKEITSRLGPAAPLIPQWGTASGRGRAGSLHRHPNSARPKLASDYGLLAPADPTGNQAAAETQVHEDSHRATMGMGNQDERDTDAGDRNR